MVKTVRNFYNDVGLAIDLDSSGNIYLGAHVGASYDGNVSSSRIDQVLIKFNSSGTNNGRNWEWSTSGQVNDVIVDSSNNVYMLIGYVNGGFDGFNQIGGNDDYIVKYNSSGTKIWSKLFGSTQDDSANRMDFDTSGNLYITGWTRGDLNGISNSGSYDIYIIKMNSSGTIIWTKLFGTNQTEIARGIVVDPRNYFYITGGSHFNNTTSGQGYNQYDVITLKYDSDGNLQ